jgi:hypothetical protein
MGSKKREYLQLQIPISDFKFETVFLLYTYIYTHVQNIRRFTNNEFQSLNLSNWLIVTVSK